MSIICDGYSAKCASTCIIHPIINQSYESKILSSWEEVYRQGLLTFWIFVSLKDGELDVQSIKAKVEDLTNGSYVAAEQTLYRVLRKNYDLELVDYREVPSRSGPKKKLYTLSKLGNKLLEDFVYRNIKLFYQPIIKNIIKE